MQKQLACGRSCLTLLHHVLFLRALSQLNPTCFKSKSDAIERICSIPTLPYLTLKVVLSLYVFSLQVVAWFFGVCQHPTIITLLASRMI